jgi:hypothetical protein
MELKISRAADAIPANARCNQAAGNLSVVEKVRRRERLRAEQ